MGHIIYHLIALGMFKRDVGALFHQFGVLQENWWGRRYHSVIRYRLGHHVFAYITYVECHGRLIVAQKERGA